MKKKLLTILAAINISAAAGTYAASPISIHAATTSERTEMRSFIRNTLAQNHVRGSVVIIKDGKPQQVSYGWAWYGKRIGNGNQQIIYPTASLQKVITGAMIVQLINETAKSNQPITQYTKISRWFPKLKNANQISIGNLLTHTSGITATGTKVDGGHNYSEAQAINWVIKKINGAPEQPVGTYCYNNANYILLAGIIRKVTNQSYEANFINRIVHKLGLTHTYLYQDIPANLTDAISYNYDGSKNYKNATYVKRSLASQLPGAGNLFSTPMDYYKIQLGLTNGQILNSSDFYYLTHLKTKITDYSGGIYLKNNDALKMAYGNLAGNHYGNWFQMTSDNQNGMIMFLNQTNNDENSIKAVSYQILNHIKLNIFSPK